MLTREEAIAILTALPVASIEGLKPKPGDIIVVELSRHLRNEGEVAGLTAVLTGLWPDHKVIVCDLGMRLFVASEVKGRSDVECES